MLPDVELIGLIREGNLQNVPEDFDKLGSKSPVQPGSVDLHIRGIYLPGAAADERGGENHPISDYNLKAGETVLVSTCETLRLPKNIGGFAFPPSRFAAKALLVTNGGHVDPQYSGPLRFTIINMGRELQRLEIGSRVGTLVLFHTSSGVARGWTERNGGPGKLPNTGDLGYLSRDFADVEERAERIAHAEVQEAQSRLRDEVEKAQRTLSEIEGRVNHRLNITIYVASLVVAVVIAVAGWFSPVAKLETKVDGLTEQFSQRQRTDQRLSDLEQKYDAIAGQLDALNRQPAANRQKSK
jgi:deoxycytidine triphosphate deaminase